MPLGTLPAARRPLGQVLVVVAVAAQLHGCRCATFAGAFVASRSLVRHPGAAGRAAAAACMHVDEPGDAPRAVLPPMEKPVVKMNPSVVREQRVLAARALQLEMGLEGIFAIYKPANWSSFDVVSKVRNTLQRVFQAAHPTVRLKYGQIKVGHGGTLDPLATGVLVVAVGRATKLIEAYTAGSKMYETVVQLGFETTTGDTAGDRLEPKEWGHVTEQMVLDACDGLTGDIMQVPPIFSALNVNGKRAYELAREGATVELDARPAQVYSIELVRPFDETAPHIHLAISCGGGTYVRSIARDLGRALDSAAHMTSLIRTKHGEFSLDACLNHTDIDDATAIVAKMRENDETLRHILRQGSVATPSARGLKRALVDVAPRATHGCNYCGKEFPSKNALFRHLRGHGGCSQRVAKESS